jgi:HlyD family secretion protein
MPLKKILQYLALFLSFFTVCCDSEKVSVITYDLSRKDFIEKIDATGTIQSTSVLTITAPGHIFTATVVFLADNGSYVKKGDTICILDAPDIYRNYDNASSKLEELKLNLNKLLIENELELSLLRSELDNMEIRIALNSLDSMQKQFAPPVQQKLLALELEIANVEKNKLDKKHNSQKLIFEAARRGLISQINLTETNLKNSNDQLNSLIIVAPRDGLVMHTESPHFMMMTSRGIGSAGGKIAVNSSVFRNMAVLQMPGTDEMEVLVEIPEADYLRILPGQKVNIQVDAVKEEITGEIKRKNLTGRKPDHNSSIMVYEAIVGLDSCFSSLIPGMSTRCEIIVNQVYDTIVVPAMAVFEKESLKIIYVANKRKFHPIPVETGHSNSSSTIVTGGLAGNETIALVEPSASMIDRKISPHDFLPTGITLASPADSVIFRNSTEQFY